MRDLLLDEQQYVEPWVRVVVWMKGEDRVAIVESGADESLNKNTTACLIKTTSHLSNSAKVESMFWPWMKHVESC